MVASLARALTGAALALALAGCAPRGRLELQPSAAEVGAVQQILVASARVPAADGLDQTAAIAAGLNFSDLRVSVPPDRRPGTVNFPAPGRSPDPRTDFLTVGAMPLADRAAFIRAVDAAAAVRPAAEREVFVFVHGFNTNFAEGLYRQAQVRHDFHTPGISVHFAWASAARLGAYGSDRESALVARDGLQDLLGVLAQTRAKRIVVMAHSMGALVAMEALRQTAIAGDRAVLAKIDSVVLIAPDLDIQVFRRQMLPLADRGIRAYVFTSSRDRALRLSARLRGSTDRLGLITDGVQVAGLPVDVIDLSALSAEGDSLNHFKAATSPTVIAMVQGMGTVGLQMLRDQQPGNVLVAAGTGLAYSAGNLLAEAPGAR
jgi:esterase/lipase superfamily enzyme